MAQAPYALSVDATGWGVLGALSVVLLVLALVVPEELGVALGTIGLAGLLVFRLSALYGDWMPRRPDRADAPSAYNDGTGDHLRIHGEARGSCRKFRAPF